MTARYVTPGEDGRVRYATELCRRCNAMTPNVNDDSVCFDCFRRSRSTTVRVGDLVRVIVPGMPSTGHVARVHSIAEPGRLLLDFDSRFDPSWFSLGEVKLDRRST